MYLEVSAMEKAVGNDAQPITGVLSVNTGDWKSGVRRGLRRGCWFGGLSVASLDESVLESSVVTGPIVGV